MYRSRMTTEGLRNPASRTPRAATMPAAATPSVDPERTPPIKMMAFGGLLVVLFISYVWGRWITGPNFTPVPPGPTPAPGWMIFALRSFEVGGILLALFVLWRFVVRPWRRDGR